MAISSASTRGLAEPSTSDIHLMKLAQPSFLRPFMPNIGPMVNSRCTGFCNVQTVFDIGT